MKIRNELFIIILYMFSVMNADAAAVVSRSSRASISRAPTISVNSNTSTTTTTETTTQTTTTTTEPEPVTEDVVDDVDDYVVEEYVVEEYDDEPIVVENKSLQFSSSLGDTMSSGTTSSDTALADMVRAQRAALDAAGNTVTTKRSANTSNTCDADLRACMTDKCGKNFSKCASDTDTMFGTKLDSCRRNTKCDADEYKAFTAEIKADRVSAIKLQSFNDIIDCGKNYDACIVNQCGATYSKCLGKSAGDAAISKCGSIAKQCNAMDSGLASRTMSVFGTLRQTAEKQISTDEKKLYTMHDQMRSTCARLGAMLDDRSLDCVYTVNFLAGGDSTLYSSKKVYAGNTFDCTPAWFGVDVTTYMENAYRLTREQSSASSAMLGSGVGMAVGALTSGAIDRAIDTQKADKELCEAKAGMKWSSFRNECVEDDSEEKAAKKQEKEEARQEKREERQTARDVRKEAKNTEKACKQSGGRWQNEACDCSEDPYLETKDNVCVVRDGMQFAKNCRDSKGTLINNNKSCNCENGNAAQDGTCPTKREANKAARQEARDIKQQEQELEQRRTKCLQRGAGGTWYDNKECHCEKPGTLLEDDKCVYKDKESKEAQDKIDNCNETKGDWDYDINTCTCRNGGTVGSNGKCPSDNAVKRAENRAERQETKYITNCTSSNGRMNSTNTECICPGNDVFPDKNGNCPKQKAISTKAEKPTAQRACVDGQLINDECYCNNERTKIADKDGYCNATPKYVANCTSSNGRMNSTNTECICPGNDVFPDKNGNCPKQKATGTKAEKPTAQRACVDGQLINDECYCNNERTEIAGEDGYCPKAARTNCTTQELKNLGYEHAVKGTVKQQDKSGKVTKCDITECEYGYELNNITNKCKESRTTKQETQAAVKAEKQAEQQKQQELKRQQELCDKDPWGKWSTVPEPICRCGDDRYWTGERCRPNDIQNQRYENCEISNGHVVNKGHADEFCDCYGSFKPDADWNCPPIEDIKAKLDANEQELCENDPYGKWWDNTCRCLDDRQWIDRECKKTNTQQTSSTLSNASSSKPAAKTSNENSSETIYDVTGKATDKSTAIRYYEINAQNFVIDKYCDQMNGSRVLCSLNDIKCANDRFKQSIDTPEFKEDVIAACISTVDIEDYRAINGFYVVRANKQAVQEKLR